ncbi:hypothetical protein [Streptomyces eurythermus]|uniref:hypothetical protein n=1 Tax=Streptomyces eurythermus TaxID=42237 RepID=UPI0033F33B33
MSMRPVSCEECGTGVLVEKRSLPHTSVQWTGPTDRCPQLAGSGARIEGCTRLRASIEREVREGRLTVAHDD